MMKRCPWIPIGMAVAMVTAVPLRAAVQCENESSDHRIPSSDLTDLGLSREAGKFSFTMAIAHSASSSLESTPSPWIVQGTEDSYGGPEFADFYTPSSPESLWPLHRGEQLRIDNLSRASESGSLGDSVAVPEPGTVGFGVVALSACGIRLARRFRCFRRNPIN
jgi:hypothetical protein